MNKRILSKILIGLLLIGILPLNVTAQTETAPKDRQYWVDLLYWISAPILENMSKGEFKKNMNVKLSPTWLKGRNTDVVYMEASTAWWMGSPRGLLCRTIKRKEGNYAKKYGTGHCGTSARNCRLLHQQRKSVYDLIGISTVRPARRTYLLDRSGTTLDFPKSLGRRIVFQKLSRIDKKIAGNIEYKN